jgi:hypothetical protein
MSDGNDQLKEKIEYLLARVLTFFTIDQIRQLVREMEEELKQT